MNVCDDTWFHTFVATVTSTLHTSFEAVVSASGAPPSVAPPHRTRNVLLDDTTVWKILPAQRAFGVRTGHVLPMLLVVTHTSLK